MNGSEIFLTTAQVRAIAAELDRQDGLRAIYGGGPRINRMTVKQADSNGWKGVVVTPIEGETFTVGHGGLINEEMI